MNTRKRPSTSRTTGPYFPRTRWAWPSTLLLALACSSTGVTKNAEGEPPSEDAAPAAEASAPREPHVVVSDTAIDDLQQALKRGIAAAGPGVVSIYTTKTVTLTPSRSPFGGESFPFFFDMPRGQPRELEQQGLGSGFVIDTEGHILTNNHVVEGAEQIRVKLADDRELDAELIGTDPPTDLALLKVEAENLNPLEFGDSDVLEVGDWVLAIGNPFGLPRTVSAGIVSAKGRANVGIVDYEDFIQTDAAVNPGNSGGPLVDLEGRVIGINTAIASRSGGNNGIAFAIPVNMAKSVVEQLRSDGKVVRGHLGIMISELSRELADSFEFDGEQGILVQDVVDGGAADEAGIRSGDIITKLDGALVTSVPAFRGEIARKRPGSSVRLELWNDGKHRTVTAELGELSGAKSNTPEGASPKLGLRLEDPTPELRRRLGLDDVRGPVVTAVDPASPAATAGIRVGDVLEQVGNREVDSAAEAEKLMRGAQRNGGVRLRVVRNGQGRFVFIRMKP